MHRLAIMVAALWWGSLTGLLFMVVPMLFASLPTPAMAGSMAARLFSAQTWVAAVGGVLFFGFSLSKLAKTSVKSSVTDMRFVAIAVALALLVEFWAAPHIVARENLPLWHRLGAGMLFGQWLLCGGLLWRLGGSRP
ncbi:MAG: DUF4149 domain-containing protein [Burkholderiaceae bacterium]|nr:DUF4149 domain-containing protein [Burkholderiaceae bacterium]